MRLKRFRQRGLVDFKFSWFLFVRAESPSAFFQAFLNLHEARRASRLTGVSVPYLAASEPA